MFKRRKRDAPKEPAAVKLSPELEAEVRRIAREAAQAELQRVRAAGFLDGIRTK